MKKDTSILLNQGNEHSKELEFLSKQETKEYFDSHNFPVYFIIKKYSNMKEVMKIMRQYGKSRGEIQYAYSNTKMLTGSSVVYLDLKDVDEAKKISEVIGLEYNTQQILSTAYAN